MNDLTTTLQALENKYFDLVWYARKAPLEDTEFWDFLTPDIRKAAMNCVFEVEGKWPEECKAIADPDEGNWAHGFNSGMLAGMRHVLALIEKDQCTLDSFPFLDT